MPDIALGLMHGAGLAGRGGDVSRNNPTLTQIYIVARPGIIMPDNKFSYLDKCMVGTLHGNSGILSAASGHDTSYGVS